MAVLVLGFVAFYATIGFGGWSGMGPGGLLLGIAAVFVVAIAYTYYYRDEFD